MPNQNVNEDIDEFIKEKAGDERLDDDKLKLKLKLKVWDEINTFADNQDEKIKEKRLNELFESYENLNSFMGKVNKSDEWFLGKIVDEKICAKCGTCSIVCTDEAIYFDDFPYIDIECPRKGFGTCYNVCPRISKGSYQIREKLDLQEEYYHTKDFNGNTTSLINYLLETLIEQGKIDGAIFVGNYKWKPVSMIVTDKWGLEDTTREHYAISSLDAITEAAIIGLKKIAVVCLPCQTNGLRNVQYFKLNHGYDIAHSCIGEEVKLPEIEYIISIFCKNKYEHDEMLQLLEMKNIEIEDVNKFDISVENLKIVTDEEVHHVDFDEIKPSPGCTLCDDFDGELADISLGSVGSEDDETSIIIRTEKGRFLKKYMNLEEGIDLNKLNTERKTKIDNYHKELEKREKNGQYNSYYNIHKYKEVSSGVGDKLILTFPTPLGGYYNPDDVIKVAEIAKKYDVPFKISVNENIHFENVPPKYVEPIMEEIYEIDGFLDNPSSSRLTTCAGSEFCRIGLFDTRKMADKCNEIVDKKELANRLKIYVTGCPYYCVNYTLADFGISAFKYPEINPDNCIGCGSCVEHSYTRSITIVDEKAVIDYDTCIGCGKCFLFCYNDAKDIKKEGFKVYIGGKERSKIVEGIPVEVYTEEEVYALLEKTIDLIIKYRKNDKERLYPIMQRVGQEKFMKELLS